MDTWTEFFAAFGSIFLLGVAVGGALVRWHLGAW
jgi:hypothetical protein